MKKKDIIEGRVIRTDYPNVGIVEVEGIPVKIKGAIKGQQVRAQIQKARKDRCEARLLEVCEASDLECSEGVCPNFGKCGGCFYASLPYEEEIRIKEEQVRRLLAPAMGEVLFEEIYRGIIPSPTPEGYRNKMEFSFGDEYKEGPLALGMHKKGSFYDIVTVEDCNICDRDFTTVLSATLSYFSRVGTPFYHRLKHDGYLRHLLVRKGVFTGQLLVSLVTASGLDDKVLEGWKEAVLGAGIEAKIAGILHTKNDRISDVVEDQGTRVLYGLDYFHERLLALDFKVSPFSFFQTNSYGAEKLYELVRDLVPESGTVYDLYCGTGTIGQILAHRAERVIGVEIVPEAVDAARENARTNGIDNIEFLCGDVLKALEEIETPPDMIVLDPPREGVHPKALSRILSYGVEKIVYVSCKPTSLARDIPAFLENKYKPEYIRLVDMFPRTANVETVITFAR